MWRLPRRLRIVKAVSTDATPERTALARRVPGGTEPSIPPRGPVGLAWARFKRDRAALVAGLVFVSVLLACAVGGPLAARAVGHGPNDPFPYAVDVNLKPVGPWTRVPDTNASVASSDAAPTTLLVLGADGQLGRDLFLRLLYGGQVSLAIGIGAAALALLIGVPVGVVSGYVGGWTDWSISRFTELFMGFPLLLFLVAIGYTIGGRFSDATLGGLLQPGVLALVFLIGVFSWFLPARVIRAEVVSLRAREFVEAARMVGASDGWIMRKHVLPHLVAPIVIWGTLMTATFVIFEAAISVLNVGVKLPTASWGNLLSTNWGTLLVFDPFRPGTTYYVERSNWVVFWPTAALFVAIVTLAILAEGIRRAFEPRGGS